MLPTMMMMMLMLMLMLMLSAAACAASDETSAPSPAPEARALDPTAARIGEPVADAAFTDTAGAAGTLVGCAASGPLVIACVSVDCPISRKYAPRLVELDKLYRERGVTVVVVDCAEDSDEDIRAAIARYGFTMRVVDDRDRSIAKALRPRTTTDTFVIDREARLRYRGAIDDRHGLTYDREERAREFLVDALEAVLADKPVALPATAAPGCEIAVAGSDQPLPHLTWTKQINRIVQRSCQDCHRPEGGAPFSLLTYDQAKRKRAVIQRAVSTRTMPPWFAHPAVGGPWSNDRRLSDQDLRAVTAWIAADCPEGDPADAPPPRTWTSEWEIGEPDAVVQLQKPIEVPAQGRMDYQYVYVPTDFGEDKWVQAVEMRPTAPQVVHHAQAFLVLDGKKLYDEKRRGDGRLDCYFAAMVPGDRCQVYPAGTARLLPKGATIMFEVHYVPNGEAARDQMRVGMVFAPAKPTHEVHSFDISCSTIAIPPGAKDYTATARFTLPVAARLLAFQPHMHLRGTSFALDLTLPDGSKRPLLSVPTWDFRWQISYRMGVPLDVPAGSTLTVTGRYDNSADNPANPDPTAMVRAGGETTDEMLVGFGEWHALPQDPPPAP